MQDLSLWPGSLHAIGSNASGYVGTLADVQLHLHGHVMTVQVPASWAQFSLGLMLRRWEERAPSMSMAG